MRMLITTALLGLATWANAADLDAVLSGRGIWWDNPNNLQMLTRLNDLSIRRVHIMLTHSPARNVTSCANAKVPKPTASNQQLLTLAKILRDQSKAVIATVYLPPTTAAMDSLFDKDTGPVTALANQGIDAFELDLEGPWSEHVPCGFPNHAAAVDDFKARAKALGYPTGITTHSGHLRNAKVPLVKADFVSLQAYSTCKPDENNCPDFDDPMLGPGGREKAVFARLKGFTGPVILGLAAYKQKWNGHSVSEAMNLSLTSAQLINVEQKNVHGYSYWSTENVEHGPQVYEFLRDTKQ